ncbi:hypothetical protein MMC13_004258 [Lambiella insularis]|nr:hypothetical protein [Lambiella insularis]
MSETLAHQISPVDPAAIDPTTTASEARSDPIRPTETDALLAESRPELVSSTEAPEIASESPNALPTARAATGGATPVDAQPVTEGVLGYKAPGLLKGLRFSKKFFWLGDEALDERSMTSYLKSEKPEIAHHNSAHALQTGKGLLLFAKRVEDKTQPAGVLNLSEASDFSKEELNEFSLKLHGHKHAFQANSKAERDSWLSAVEACAAEAKISRQGIVGSEGYKKHMNKLAPAAATALPPTAAARSASRPTKGMDTKVHDGTQGGNVAAAEGTPRVTDKSRSQSRKRQSIFGKVLGKKDDIEEKKEIKKEDKVEKNELKADEAAEKADLKEVKNESMAEETAEGAKVQAESKGMKHDESIAGTSSFDAAAVAARVMGEPVLASGDSKVEVVTATAPTESTASQTASTATPEIAPKPAKRASVFGNLFGKKDGVSPTIERKEKEIVPAVPAKNTEPVPVTTSVPQVEPVSTSTPAVEPMSTEQETAAVIPAAKAGSPSESKGGMFGFLKQKEVQREEKKGEKIEAKAEEKTEKPIDDLVAATGAPIAPGSGTSAPVATDAVATTGPADIAKDKRRQSFFGGLGGKKERKTDPSSDSETTGGKLGGMFRRASRSTKGSQAPGTDPAIPPTPISKDIRSTIETAQSNGITDSAVPEETHKSIVPEPAATSQPATVSATA